MIGVYERDNYALEDGDVFVPVDGVAAFHKAELGHALRENISMDQELFQKISHPADKL